MNHEVIVGIGNEIIESASQVQPVQPPVNQGAVAQIVKFEDRTDLTPEQRQKILAERENQAPSTDES